MFYDDSYFSSWKTITLVTSYYPIGISGFLGFWVLKLQGISVSLLNESVNKRLSDDIFWSISISLSFCHRYKAHIYILFR